MLKVVALGHFRPAGGVSPSPRARTPTFWSPMNEKQTLGCRRYFRFVLVPVVPSAVVEACLFLLSFAESSLR